MKAKGSNAERQLVAKFWSKGFASIRVAGSGSSRFPCPDVLASNGKKVFAIEAKATKKEYQYFRQEQINDLIEFSRIFLAEPILAIKFSSKWYFFRLDKLEFTPKGDFSIKKSEAENKGIEFDQLIL
jgi:Holliday junction resolvase|tara:strand:+ start:158 stop:538 length:381 start_codon:yes stop_codon:yes gene_type:complete